MRLHRYILLDTTTTTTMNFQAFQSVLLVSLDILTNLFEAGCLSTELLSWDYSDYRSSPESLLEEIVFWSQLAIDCKKKLHLRPEGTVRLKVMYPLVSCNSFNLMSKLLNLSKYILLSSPLYHMLPSQLSKASRDDGGSVKRKPTATPQQHPHSLHHATHAEPKSSSFHTKILLLKETSVLNVNPSFYDMI